VWLKSFGCDGLSHALSNSDTAPRSVGSNLMWGHHRGRMTGCPPRPVSRPGSEPTSWTMRSRAKRFAVSTMIVRTPLSAKIQCSRCQTPRDDCVRCPTCRQHACTIAPDGWFVRSAKRSASARRLRLAPRQQLSFSAARAGTVNRRLCCLRKTMLSKRCALHLPSRFC
jgi:hypothetical protein